MTAEEAYQARLRRSKMITQAAATEKDDGNADNKIKKMRRKNESRHCELIRFIHY